MNLNLTKKPFKKKISTDIYLEVRTIELWVDFAIRYYLKNKNLNNNLVKIQRPNKAMKTMHEFKKEDSYKL